MRSPPRPAALRLRLTSFDAHRVVCIQWNYIGVEKDPSSRVLEMGTDENRTRRLVADDEMTGGTVRNDSLRSLPEYRH